MLLTVGFDVKRVEWVVELFSMASFVIPINGDPKYIFNANFWSLFYVKSWEERFPLASTQVFELLQTLGPLPISEGSAKEEIRFVLRSYPHSRKNFKITF